MKYLNSCAVRGGRLDITGCMETAQTTWDIGLTC